MHIVSASDDKYAIHLGVMLTSLFMNQDQTEHINIYIIDGNLSESNKLKLQLIVERFNSSIHFLEIDDEVFHSFNERKRISKQAYYRILIPNLLSTDINKALYLDCDLIVTKDLTALWETNIEDYHLAAVESTISKKLIKYISLPTGSGYFNSGVLLLNLEKWREDNTSEKIIRYKEKHPDQKRFMDQDALNAVLYDKWLKLHYKWNYTTGHWNRRKIYPQKDAVIIHFTTRKKPWNSEHPFKNEYYKYLRSSLLINE
ncbi:glycosyltransferase family 8 protein [Metabacillus litoralis]|uniref:Glycosyltransferase family 8 protein n=1 Tax=Metabacillus litoralis TaxID=152268 RepID=A0A5C6WA94_9BACI|nr:glycosyltransferase family 8 protein [Metabacillus litoralis]TXC92799.1 glycosyltransferase family 8 protein [Metabacillus litoralis]